MHLSVYDEKGRCDSRAREIAGLVAAPLPTDPKLHSLPLTVACRQVLSLTAGLSRACQVIQGKGRQVQCFW